MEEQKINWFDTETTGTDKEKNAIVQLSGIIEIKNGNPMDDFIKEYDILMRPFTGAEISEEALEVNGRTNKEIANFPEWQKQIEGYKTAMGKYVDKFNKNDKFIPAGYNIGFDIDMLFKSFERLGDNYFWSWFFWPCIDVKVKVAEYMIKTGLRLKKYNLETVCNNFGIQIDAHDSMSDIRATRNLYYFLDEELKTSA